MVQRSSFGVQRSPEEEAQSKECCRCSTTLSADTMSVWHYKGTKFVGVFCSTECADEFVGGNK